MNKLTFISSKRKKNHFTFDGRNAICRVKHKHKASVVHPGTDKESNCKNCSRIWKALKIRRRKEYLKKIGKLS